MVVAAALGTVGVAVVLVGPGYFAEAMGHGANDPAGQAMDAATRAAFGDAMLRTLGAATVIAVVAATILSFAVAGRIVGPIDALAAAARRIAHGHYAERVPVEEGDEIGDLAGSFNEMAASLEATERRRVQLVGDVAHELRTPLTTLDGYLEGLEDGVVAAAPATWTLLRGETARLTRLVNDLAELWRAEARQVPLHLEPVDLAVIASEATVRVGPVAAGRTFVVAPSTPGTVAVAGSRPRGADRRELPDERRPPRSGWDSGHGRCRPDCGPDAPMGGRRRTGTHGGPAGGRLRALLPGRPVTIPGAGRIGHRARHRPGLCGCDGWTRLGDERGARPWVDLPPGAARRLTP